MKTPICDLCVRSGTLCNGCQKKISEGTISRLDFEVAQILVKINENHNISEASFVRTVDLGKVVLIMTEGEVGLLIGRGGSVVSQISSALNRKVRIVEYTPDLHKSISDIILPARLLGINTVYHAGKEMLRVRLPKSDLRAVPIDIDSLERVIASWANKPVQISFE